MSLFFALAVACAARQSLANDAIYSDVPDNHVAYDLIRDLQASGLLPEYRNRLLRGNWPLTRGEFGAYVAEAAINLAQYVNDHRLPKRTQKEITYSMQMSDLSEEELKYLVAVVPRIRTVAKTFAMNLPSFVAYKKLDASLVAEGNLIDGLLSGA